MSRLDNLFAIFWLKLTQRQQYLARWESQVSHQSPQAQHQRTARVPAPRWARGRRRGVYRCKMGESKTTSTTQVIPMSRPDPSGAPATCRTQHEHSGEQLSWIPQRTVTQAGPPQARLPINMEHREPAWADTAGFKLQTQILSGATKPEKPTMQRLCFTAAGHRLNGDQDFISDMVPVHHV
ncbi:Hypothetical predicted protein [Pelobates cultripes]|uniref:Uncharacterized protein n=1 Tax=Pelobates cultripes TaxID=61616 RepID=A0AAD1W5G1_PELCU|nr:Hypothetical predicted protein [Pelobates cultripes]